MEDLLFEKACEKYLQYYEINHRPYTYEKYALTVAKPLKAFFNGYRFSQIAPAACA